MEKRYASQIKFTCMFRCWSPIQFQKERKKVTAKSKTAGPGPKSKVRLARKPRGLEQVKMQEDLSSLEETLPDEDWLNYVGKTGI